MATWSHRTSTVTVTRHEWSVPATGEGAYLGDVASAINAAADAYRAEHGTSEFASVPDDAIQIRPEEDVIVVHFTVERRA